MRDGTGRLIWFQPPAFPLIPHNPSPIPAPRSGASYSPSARMRRSPVTVTDGTTTQSPSRRRGDGW